MSVTHKARERLLEAAREVFAQFGAAGATTRRIAEVAGVNEVTVFRHFGSKEALLDEAARTHVTGEHGIPLPDTPKNPLRELTAWCDSEISRLGNSRAFILQCLSEESSHPELGEFGALAMSQAADELAHYVERLTETGRVRHADECDAAMTMFLGALYTDALGRVNMPRVVRVRADRASSAYVTLFLRAIGAK